MEYGEVITFYSFTGGAGRSSAVSNVACLLARREAAGRGVLAVDWNLDAPGLHHFFRPLFRQQFPTPEDLDAAPGLLDLFTHGSRVVEETPGLLPVSALQAIDPQRFVLETDIPGLSLLKAGTIGETYYQQVTAFDWRGLDDHAPWLIPSLLDFWRERYRYILIESPAGVNEMSGMCSMMLPDKLALLFAPTRQSLDGALEIARFAQEYRKSTSPDRPLSIFPVPSRIDLIEAAQQERWRFSASGFQPRFEREFKEIHGLADCRLHGYFTDVLLPYQPRYAFGEDIAVLADHGDERSALARAFERLGTRLSSAAHAWEEPGESGDSSSVEIEGRMVPLAEAEPYLLSQIPLHMAKRDNARLSSTLRQLAALEARAGHVAEARSYYQQAVVLVRALDSGPLMRDLLEDMGNFERKQGLVEDALKALAEAMSLADGDLPPRRRARLLLSLAGAERDLQRSEQARAHYEEALEIYRGEQNRLGVAIVSQSLAEIERDTDPPRAEQDLCRAAEIFELERETERLAGCLRTLADLQRREGRLADAHQQYVRSLAVSRSNGNGSERARTLLGLAKVDRRMRKFPEAEESYREALELFRSDADRSGLAAAVQGLAELEFRRGNLPGARAHFEEAISELKQVNDPLGTAHVRRGLGDVARRAGDLDAAYGHYEQAMELYRGLYNSLGQANALLCLGEIDRRQGRLEIAHQRYCQALQLYRQSKGRLGEANTLKSLGDLEGEQEQFRIARSYYLSAAEAYEAEQNLLGQANTFQALGDLERRLRRYAQAAEWYGKARDLYSSEQFATGLAYTYSELARVSHALCDFGGSMAYLQQALAAASETDLPGVKNYVWTVSEEIRAGLAMAS
ncbi:MAG: tetratricopeptide repeat protein [Bryobacteraceae bacterium]